MRDWGTSAGSAHQTLIRPRALLEAEWLEVRCVHADIYKYPLVLLESKYGISLCLTHPLILGTDWPGFSRSTGQCIGMHLQPAGTCGISAVLSGDAGLSNADSGEEEMVRLLWEGPPVQVTCYTEGFLLKQSWRMPYVQPSDLKQRLQFHILY